MEGLIGSLTGLLVPLGAFAMVAWILYTIVEGLRRWYQQRSLNQFQTKLLDKIGSVGELGAFMNSAGGERFLEALKVESAGPEVRIIRATQSGTVLTMLGLSLFGYLLVRPLDPGAANEIAMLATIFMAIGVGLLISARLSFGLSRRLGLIDQENRRETPSPSHTA